MGRKAATNDTIRRNLTLSDAVIETMEFLASATEASSASGVVRQALTALEAYVEDTGEGVTYFIKRPDGSHFDVVPSLFAPDTEAAAMQKVNMILHNGADKRINVLRDRIGAASDSEVVRTAIKFYDLLVREYVAGGDLALLYPDGESQVVRFVGMAPRPRRVSYKPIRFAALHRA